MTCTGSSVIAASSAARWESDLSGGAATVPRSGPSGAKPHGRATVSPRPSTSACASSARPSPATHSAIVPEDMSGAG